MLSTFFPTEWHWVPHREPPRRQYEHLATCSAWAMTVTGHRTLPTEWGHAPPCTTCQTWLTQHDLLATARPLLDQLIAITKPGHLWGQR